MTDARTIRPIPLALMALTAISAAPPSCSTHGEDATPRPRPTSTPTPRRRPHTGPRRPAASLARRAALRQEMRRLWEDHVTWTRLAVISLTLDARTRRRAWPGSSATRHRHLKRGQALYGRAAGQELTRPLREREHITIAADLIAAAKSGDQAKLADEQAAWRRNRRSDRRLPQRRQSQVVEAR